MGNPLEQVVLDLPIGILGYLAIQMMLSFNKILLHFWGSEQKASPQYSCFVRLGRFVEAMGDVQELLLYIKS